MCVAHALSRLLLVKVFGYLAKLKVLWWVIHDVLISIIASGAHLIGEKVLIAFGGVYLHSYRNPHILTAGKFRPQPLLFSHN